MRDQFDISGFFETTEFEIAQVACTSISGLQSKMLHYKVTSQKRL